MYDYAIADCIKAIEIDANCVVAYSSRGFAYNEKGMYDHAIADCSKAIKIDPHYSSAYNTRGVAYSRKEMYERAIADFDKCIRLNPSYMIARKNRKYAFLLRDRLDSMNVQNRTLFIADNLDIMRGMDSNTIDLIYLDPPFNTKKNYKAPIGSPAEGASFKDIWTDEDVKHEWHGEVAETNEELYQIIQAAEVVYDKSMKLYLMAMTVRLFEMHRLLKDTGSIYLHCDPTASHYLKLVMDSLFGRQNFCNEIVWCYQVGARSKKQFGRKHDVILFYSRSKNYVFDSDAVRIERQKTHMKVETDSEGRTWQVKKDAKSGKVYRYPTDLGVLCPDWWVDIQQLNRSEKERTGYPTQKPLALLQRIIKASSNEGDSVLDRFCGCATACVAAEQLQRQDRH